MALYKLYETETVLALKRHYNQRTFSIYYNTAKQFGLSQQFVTEISVHMCSRFPTKIALYLKKVCYKVSLCENCERQSCKASIGLSIRSKMIDGGRPLLREILADTDPPPCNTPMFNLFLNKKSDQRD